MSTKIAIGLGAGILIVLVVFAIRQQHYLADAALLSRRVADLEIQNVALSRQLEQMLETRQRRESSPTRIAVQRRGQGAGERVDDSKPESAQERGTVDEYDLEGVKQDLRAEVESIVKAEQDESRQKRRAEWESQMREGLQQSLGDFAEDNGLSDEMVAQLSLVMDELLEKRRTLHDDMDARNISFYEFGQENRKLQAEVDERLRRLLTPQQMEAFGESFPMMGHGGGGRPRMR